MPIYHGVPLPFQPWLQGLILALIAVVGFFTPTAKFASPLRFYYLHQAAHLPSIYRLLLDWWVYAALFLVFSPAVLPSAGLGLMAMSVASWVHVYRKYVRQRAAIVDAVARHVTLAWLAASETQEDAATTTARRDALQAQLI
ncbi:hypothetical protein DL766_007815 [Monosporascus sp. MC13-8B]|uniref:CSC1/OSCA1-like 7TM region domain-containing protein n=1 Tax=Monosporascus cannonballus TaxID=155416 RepID=A0ABY0GYP9_9PEZI|nr:hypothetical protein DL762_007656 [Monosporascus cannonballus]RYO98559.1 hypothetical protein DL763_002089 [Monosporascus cannonballus]RYP21966.1 hypothetical protein DL766_007815 [Monosporascus sp. MC13-8B]